MLGSILCESSSIDTCSNALICIGEEIEEKKYEIEVVSSNDV